MSSSIDGIVASVGTDLLDYAPGSTAIVTASGFIVGSTLEFQVLHVSGPGDDGVYGTADDVIGDNAGEGHDAWRVTDGEWWLLDAGADGIEGSADDVIGGDLDRSADGSIVTTWTVSPDDSAGATFRLSATVLDADGAPTGEIAMASFTDSLLQVAKTAGDAPDGETYIIDAGGQTFTYFYAVSHTGTAPGDSPLTLTSLIDDNGTPGDPSDDLDLIALNAYVGGDTIGNGKIDVGETWLFQVKTSLALDAGESVTNVVTAIAHDIAGTEYSDSDDATVAAQDLPPAITVEKTALPAVIAAGGQTVTYRYAVTNSNTVSIDPTLTLTALIDDNGTPDDPSDDLDLIASNLYVGGDTLANGKIDFGETWLYQYRTLVTLEAGESLTNGVTAVAHDNAGTEFSASDQATVTAGDVAPVIEVVKTAGDAADGENYEIDEGGQSVTYTYAVRNIDTASPGSALTLTSLIDDRGTPDTSDDVDLIAINAYIGGDTSLDGKLDVGETWLYQYTTSVLLNASGSLTNVVTAVVHDIESTEFSASDEASVTARDLAPSIHIEKTVDADGDGTFEDLEQLLGSDDLADYRYVLTNTSPAGAADPLSIDSLIDDRGTADGADDIALVVAGVLQPGVTLDKGVNNGDALLDAGETWTYTVWDVDLSSLEFGNSLTNTASVEARDDEGNATGASDDATVERPAPVHSIVSGTKWNDLDRDGVRDPCEPGLKGWIIFVDADSAGTPGELDWQDTVVRNHVWDPGEGEQWTKTDKDGAYRLEIDYAWLADGSYQLREVPKPGWSQSFDPDLGFDVPGDAIVAGDVDFGNYRTAGVRGPGFWSNKKWMDFWDGDCHVPKQAGSPGFPGGDIVLWPVGADDGYVVPHGPDHDGKATIGILIGDYNLNGIADEGAAHTLYYSLEEARQILKPSEKPAHDARWILDRDMVTTWLNFLAGNPIEKGGDHDLTDLPEIGSPQYYLDQAIAWIHFTTGGSGDIWDTPKVRPNSTEWKHGIDLPGPAADILAGNAIHHALGAYNDTGIVDGIPYAWDADLL